MRLPIVDKVSDQLGRIGLVGERRAISLLILSLFTGYFLLLMLIVRDQLPEWFPAFAAMFGLYLTTFMGVAAGWFWGRWVAIGVGTWGTTIAIWGTFQIRALSTPLIILGVTHALIALLMSGDSMAPEYEGRAGWRKRLGLDDAAVLKLRRTVTRAASSIPAIVLFALAPRQEEGAALLACAVVGIVALLMGRTMSLVAIAGATVGAFVLSFSAVPSFASAHHFLFLPSGAPQALALYATIALGSSLAPFAGPIGRFLRSSR